jgi:hypothetical protein
MTSGDLEGNSQGQRLGGPTEGCGHSMVSDARPALKKDALAAAAPEHVRAHLHVFPSAAPVPTAPRARSVLD